MAGFRFSYAVSYVPFLIATTAMCSAAQSQAISVFGRVLDPASAPIAGARVTALPGDGRPAGTPVVSDSNGGFSLLLDAGSYTVYIRADGFTEAHATVVVPLLESRPRDFVLAVAPSHETITVSDTVGYRVPALSSSTRTLTPLRDVPQSITVVSRELIDDQMMMSMGDVVRYVPGITATQGENNRDQLVIRGNSTSADFFLDGVRDDVQYYRDLYNLDRVEALKGPNAMIFGRGGAGGVINRVAKEAVFSPIHQFTLEGGSFGNKRFTADWNQPLSDKVSLRVNAMFEDSGSFRDFVNLQRHGVNPTMTIKASENTKITLSYENFRDDRVADRGIPSFQGRPVDVAASAYFGNPNQSHVGARVNLGSAMVEHRIGRLTIRNRTLIGNYDRGYQNFVPGAVTAERSQVSISAYNNATRRLNLFNQTDLTYAFKTGRIRHTLLAGIEIGRQLTDNFRNTGYFNDSATSILETYNNAVFSTPATFRQSATDADNHLVTNLAAAYVQDQIDLSRQWQLVVGLRFDRFDLQYHNNRTGEELGRIDNLLSPRAGLVYKPIAPLSLYASYSTSYLPSSGDQFSSLTTITQQAKPEKFNNYEAGAKWDIGRAFSFTTAVFRLDRTNTRATDPNNPTAMVQTGSQRTNGVEFGVSGNITRHWKIAGGYAFQDAFVTAATTAAQAGAQAAQAPHNTFSLWNHYQILPRLAAGLGILNRTGMFAAIDDTVRLPGYTRFDAAAYYSLTERLRLQVNVENLSGRKYYLNADSNTNISPGSPRAVRAGLIVRF